MSIFLQVDSKDFISGADAAFDIYLKDPGQNPVLMMKKGTPIASQRARMEESHGSRIYLLSNDYLTYLYHVRDLVEALMNSPQADLKKKVKLLKHVLDLYLELFFNCDLEKTEYNNLRATLASALPVISLTEAWTPLQELLNQPGNFITYSHSIGVCVISILIGQQMGWNSASVQLKLATSGLLHDIGKRALPAELLTKTRIQLTPSEIELMREHPRLGEKFLSRFDFVSSEVGLAALQHHENGMGRGYPAGLRPNQVSPFSKVILVADEFCQLTLRTPDKTDTLSADQAILKMEVLLKETLDPDFFAGLAQVFKVKLQASSSKQFKEGGQNR